MALFPRGALSSSPPPLLRPRSVLPPACLLQCLCAYRMPASSSSPTLLSCDSPLVLSRCHRPGRRPSSPQTRPTSPRLTYLPKEHTVSAALIDPHGQYPRTSTHKHPPRPPTAGPTFNAHAHHSPLPPPAPNVQPDPTTLQPPSCMATISYYTRPSPASFLHRRRPAPPHLHKLITITLLLLLMKCTSNCTASHMA